MIVRTPTALILIASVSVACSSAEREAVADSATVTAAATTGSSCWINNGTAADAAARPSPLGEVRFNLGGQEAHLCYGRPSANERTVMGGLVPFGAPWRLGANEATTIHLPFNATVGDLAVDAGSYSIYAVPSQTEWEFVLNRQVERWGIPINEAVMEANAGSFKRPVATTASPVEQFTLRWEGTSDSAGQLVMEWEQTQISIPVARR